MSSYLNSRSNPDCKDCREMKLLGMDFPCQNCWTGFRKETVDASWKILQDKIKPQ